jgi:hypothetical protein
MISFVNAITVMRKVFLEMYYKGPFTPTWKNI